MASPLEGSDTVRHTYTHVAICKSSGTQSLDLQVALGPNYSRPFTGQEMKAGRDHDILGLTESRNPGRPRHPASCARGLSAPGPSAVKRGT